MHGGSIFSEWLFFVGGGLHGWKNILIFAGV